MLCKLIFTALGHKSLLSFNDLFDVWADDQKLGTVPRLQMVDLHACEGTKCFQTCPHPLPKGNELCFFQTKNEKLWYKWVTLVNPFQGLSIFLFWHSLC